MRGVVHPLRRRRCYCTIKLFDLVNCSHETFLIINAPQLTQRLFNYTKLKQMLNLTGGGSRVVVMHRSDLWPAVWTGDCCRGDTDNLHVEQSHCVHVLQDFVLQPQCGMQSSIAAGPNGPLHSAAWAGVAVLRCFCISSSVMRSVCRAARLCSCTSTTEKTKGMKQGKMCFPSWMAQDFFPPYFLFQ